MSRPVRPNRLNREPCVVLPTQGDRAHKCTSTPAPGGLRCRIDAAAVRSLVAEIPEARLREMVVDLVLGQPTAVEPKPAPTPRRSGGWPKGKPRKKAKAAGNGSDSKLAARAAKRAAFRWLRPAGSDVSPASSRAKPS